MRMGYEPGVLAGEKNLGSSETASRIERHPTQLLHDDGTDYTDYTVDVIPADPQDCEDPA